MQIFTGTGFDNPGAQGHTSQMMTAEKASDC